MTLNANDLKQFIGTETWYKYPLFPGFLYTEGVQYVAEHGQAYWLIEAIFSYQCDMEILNEPFQTWTLTVNEDQSALLLADDGNNNEIARQEIPFTDFPLPKIRFYLTNRVLLLPSEY